MLRTSLLTIGIVCAICALIFAAKRNVWAALGMALSTITIMVLIRDLLRMAWMKPYFSPASLKVVPEYAPMILFLISFAAGLVVIFYMLKIAVTSGRED